MKTNMSYCWYSAFGSYVLSPLSLWYLIVSQFLCTFVAVLVRGTTSLTEASRDQAVSCLKGISTAVPGHSLSSWNDGVMRKRWSTWEVTQVGEGWGKFSSLPVDTFWPMGMCSLTCSCLSFPYSCLGERFIVTRSSVDILILKCLMQILHEFITKLWDQQGIWTFSILCVILNPNPWKSSLSLMWITMIRTRNDYWQLQESNSEARGFFLGLAVGPRPVVVGICTDAMVWRFHQRISSSYLWSPLGLWLPLP